MSSMSDVSAREVAIVASAVGVGIAAGFALRHFVCVPKSDSLVNRRVKKFQGKVVDSVNVEDLGETTAFCRCWRSEKFPYCDGSHNKHDEQTGDNVGPLLVKKQG